MSKQKVSTFANESMKYVARSGKAKLIEVRMERDLFGSILYLALQRKIDMGEALTYPLTLAPLSLCYIDSRMNKTPKTTLMKELEKSSVLNNPEMVDMVTVDGMFFLHLLSDLPETFGFVSKSILRKLCSSFSAKRIDIAFDKIATP